MRVKDLDFEQGLVCVRSGKGDKDRSTHAPLIVSIQSRARARLNLGVSESHTAACNRSFARRGHCGGGGPWSAALQAIDGNGTAADSTRRRPDVPGVAARLETKSAFQNEKH